MSTTQRIIRQCDFCDAEATLASVHDTPEDWLRVTVQTGETSTVPTRTYDMCDDCARQRLGHQK